jgi:hypothetical protein
MDDETMQTPIPPAASLIPVVSPVQEPAKPAHPSHIVKDSDTLEDRDPHHGHGGDYKIDPDTGKRVRA